jgi:hypothetical protein
MQILEILMAIRKAKFKTGKKEKQEISERLFICSVQFKTKLDFHCYKNEKL